MNEFRRFIKRNRIEAAIKSVGLGFGVGLAVFSVLYALLKYEKLGPDLTLPYILLIAVGALVLSGVPMLLVALKSEKALAKRIDEELGLSEGLRTGVSNAGRDGLMVLAQREAIDKKLSEIPTSRVSLKGAWIFLLVLVLGVGMLIGAILLPGVEPPIDDGGEENEPPPSAEVSDFRILQLENLIKDVEISALADAPKESVLEALRTLLGKMQSAKEGEVGILISDVIDTIITVDGIIADANSFVRIKDALAGADANLVLLGESVGTLTIPMTKPGTEEVQKLFAEETAAEFAPDFLNRLSAALASSGAPESDSLYSALMGFAEDMVKAPEDADGFDMAKDKAFLTLVGLVRASLNQQYINRLVGETVIETLMTIFSLSESDLPELDIDSSDKYEEEEKEEEDKGGDGGLGTGETVYGSDDMIYFPEEDRYVTYGEAIDIYYARVSEMIANGQIPDDMRKHIEDYFAALYNGAESDND